MSFNNILKQTTSTLHTQTLKPALGMRTGYKKTWLKICKLSCYYQTNRLKCKKAKLFLINNLQFKSFETADG